MPLRALIDGEEVVSVNLSPIEWENLKQSVKKGTNKVILPCCNQTGFLRTSIKGLNHFVHQKGSNTCDWKPESPQHLLSKSEITKACIKNGWEAIPEYAEGNWRADVLAIKNSNRIAFEVQWSNQTAEETINRQQKYIASNVRCCWFFRNVPKELQGNTYDELPFFEINETEDKEIVTRFKNQEIPLYNFVDNLMKGYLKIRNNYQIAEEQEIELFINEIRCEKCKEKQHIYSVGHFLKTKCGKEVYVDLNSHPDVIEKIREFLETPLGKDFKIGFGKTIKRLNNNYSYYALRCTKCNKPFSSYFMGINQNNLEKDPTSKKFKISITFKTGFESDEIHENQNGKHWCFSKTKDFCT